MKYVKWAIGSFATIVSLWASCITIADKHGAQLQGFMLWTAENSWWMLPIACFFLGICIGRFLHKKQSNKSASNISKVAEQSTLNDWEKKFKEEPCGDKKAMAVCLFKQKNHRAAISDNGVERIKFIEADYGRAYKYLNFFRYDSRGNDTSYIELEDWLILLFTKRPILLEGFPEASLDSARSILEYHARIVPAALEEGKNND